MSDVIMLTILVGATLLLVAFVAFCDRLIGSSEVTRQTDEVAS